MLEEHQILLCLEEAYLEVQEAILVEEQPCNLYPADGWDLLAELEETRVNVDEINDERAVKARCLSQLVVGISSDLVDLGMLPIQDIPQLLKLAPEVFTAASLVLEHLREVQASGTGP
jgi:hypothetical protein